MTSGVPYPKSTSCSVTRPRDNAPAWPECAPSADDTSPLGPWGGFEGACGSRKAVLRCHWRSARRIARLSRRSRDVAEVLVPNETKRYAAEASRVGPGGSCGVASSGTSSPRPAGRSGGRTEAGDRDRDGASARHLARVSVATRKSPLVARSRSPILARRSPHPSRRVVADGEGPAW